MERRDALRVLGGSLAAVTGSLATAGCLGFDSAGRSADHEPDAHPPIESRQFSRFESTTGERVSVRLVSADVPASWRSSFHLAVFTRHYPRGGVVQAGVSPELTGFEDCGDVVTADCIRSVTVPMPDSEFGVESARFHRVALVSGGPPPAGDSKPAGPPSGNGRVVAETDRFRVESGEIVPDPHPETVGDTTQGGFSRTAVEGAYHLEIGPEDEDWALPLRVFKSAFVRGRTGWRGHDYPPYVNQATASGLAGSLSREISRAADALDVEPVPFAIDVVQALPYVPERSTAGADEYIKYPAETLVDGGGDCEDSAILLASVLQAPPIDRECALIHPPEHMGLGITGEYGGTYFPYDGRRYFYVETTGSGWQIGELPEEYADTESLVFQV